MKLLELSDRKLVELCVEGNEDAIAELLRRYKRMIARVVARTLNAASIRPTSAVEDLMQEAWARVTVDNMRPLRELQWLHDGALRGLYKRLLLLPHRTTYANNLAKKETKGKKSR